MRNIKRKIMAWLLMFSLIFYSVPVYAFADEAGVDAGVEISADEGSQGIGDEGQAAGSEDQDQDGEGQDSEGSAEEGSADGSANGDELNDSEATDESQNNDGQNNDSLDEGLTDDGQNAADESVGSENVNDDVNNENNGNDESQDGQPAEGLTPEEGTGDKSDQEIADDADKKADEEISDDETSDKVIADEEIADEEISDEEIADEVIADKVITDEAIAQQPTTTPEQTTTLPKTDEVLAVVTPLVVPAVVDGSALDALVEELAGMLENDTDKTAAEMQEALAAISDQVREAYPEKYAQAEALLGELQAREIMLVKTYPIQYSENNINYELYEDGTAKVVSGTHTNYRIDIPEFVSYDGQDYQVTSIGYSAFYKSSEQRYYAQVTLPEGLETIGDYAFYKVYLYGDELVIPDSVKSIGQYAFAFFDAYATDAYHINKIVFGEKLETIGYCAFYHNVGVTDYDAVAPFPVEIECWSNLQSVDSWAFYFRYSYNVVKSVTVHGFEGSIDNVLNGVYAFRACGFSYTDIDLNNICSLTTLQKAINQSEGPTTFELSKDIFFNKTIVIPADKDITLVDSGSEIYLEASYDFDEPMFKIEKGGKLTINSTMENGECNLVINGAYPDELSRLEATIFQVDGELVIKNGKINGGGALEKAGMFSGAIVLADNAKMSMTGGSLESTWASGAHSAPIVVGSGAEFEMSGGAITGNSNSNSIYNGYAAGAVLLYGWSASDLGGKMTLSGDAVISDNSNSGVGGAITLVGNAELYMDGGQIIGNRSVGGRNSNGGGVCVAGRTGGMNANYDAKGIFTMDGGVIANNSAYYGGGIYVNSNYVTLNAGEISGNEADMTGGGVYVETPSPNPTAVSMKNVVISGNSAGVIGGGMYFCPSGTGSLYVNEGAAIFDNSSQGAADDFVSVVCAMSGNNKSATLAQRMLGGGLVQWYIDGSVNESSMSGWGSVTAGSVRYSADPSRLLAAGTYGVNLALKAVVSDEAKALAESQATLRITGNTAQRGGGVGANGSVIVGTPTPDDEALRLKVTKVWNDDIPQEEWKPVTIQLKIGDYALETVVLNAENNWTAEFTGLPDNAKGNISVVELTEGYSVSYSDVTASEDNPRVLEVTVTNSKPKEYVDLVFVKNWLGDTAEERPESVSFQLLADGVFVQNVELTAANNWRAELNELAADKNYSVREVSVKGYTASAAKMEVVDKTITFTITNTKEIIKPEPKFGSLTVSKTVAVNGGELTEADLAAEFDFVVRLNDATINGVYGDMSFVDGVAEFSLKHGESKTASGLPDDVAYTVSEQEAEGYAPNQNDVEGSIDEAGVVVEFINTRTVTPPTPERPNEPGEPSDPGDPGDEEELITPPTPLVNEPPAEEYIPDEETPLSELPELTEEEEILDEDVPLADVPQTGDNLLLWLFAAMASGIFGLFVARSDRKRG